MENNQIPREKIPWFPTINYDLCTGNKDCLNFCPNGVYEWDNDTCKPKVKNPYSCTAFCSNCVQICKSVAISFPSIDEITDILIKIREVETI
jgi:NAD-dependent dihydropyrimidine dehydrogenase PreA subunit